ncbi:MAG: DUF1080 domain-containing protein [Armatimonadetes bacterium]|nr:DUF1080 domain-containing protein [Armatimonadota bacterium]
MNRRWLFLVLLLVWAIPAGAQGPGWVRLFDGKTLNGWTLVGGHGPGYAVENGVLVCPAEGGGNLFTEKEYSDFVFRYEFKLMSGGNNGVGIRAPLQGDAAYVGMEVQILDDNAYPDSDPKHSCSAIYDVLPVKRGAIRKAGEWNRGEIKAVGRRVTIKLNGKTVLDANLNSATDPATLLRHPGMRRAKGHIGFLGHGSRLEFRNLYIRDLSRPEKDNRPPAGFTALFNGKDLTGWKGLVASPPERAGMSREALAAAQRKADESMRAHWQVRDGAFVFDGKGGSLCALKDYGNFEMTVDWKILPGGDSGIYLRGTPQVQIWDNPVGSGGLYNNQKNPSQPLVKADSPPGQWNRFNILMIGDKVTVYLNDQLVVNDTTMENYWERDKSIYPTGQIELQNHGNTLYFKNIYLRELP